MTPATPRRSRSLEPARQLLLELAPDLLCLLLWLGLALTSRAAAWAAGAAAGIQLVRCEQAYKAWRLRAAADREIARLRALAEIRQAFARTAP